MSHGHSLGEIGSEFTDLTRGQGTFPGDELDELVDRSLHELWRPPKCLHRSGAFSGGDRLGAGRMSIDRRVDRHDPDRPAHRMVANERPILVQGGLQRNVAAIHLSGEHRQVDGDRVRRMQRNQGGYDAERVVGAGMRRQPMTDSKSSPSLGVVDSHHAAHLEADGRVTQVWKYVIFIGIPVAEIFVLAQVSDVIGVLPTILLVVITGIIGARMVVAQGRLIWQSFKLRLATGEVPDTEVAHGAMLIFAGAVLLTPGILTDAVGLALLVPSIREFLRVRFMKTARVFVR